MRMSGLSFLAAAASLAVAGPASAAISFTYTPGVGNLQPGEADYANFDTTFGSLTGTGTLIDPPPNTPAGAEPAVGDQGDVFFSVTSLQNALFNFNPADSIGHVGMDYGSADGYNTFTVYLSDMTSMSFTGQDILNTVPGAADGTQAPGAQNGRLTFHSGSSTAFITGIRLVSSVNSLEIDNIGTAPVPEPGTWAMMLLGFGGIGFAMRRRRQASALPQLA